jgi:drug/metabolite transporter (DMT)-like permease
LSKSMERATENGRRAHPWLVWAALATIYIVWGSTYLAIRVTVETLPPLLNAGARFLVAGMIVYLFLALRRGWSSLRISRRELVSCSIVGGALLLGGNGMVALAERDVSSALAALIIASVPLWVVLFRSVAGDRVHRGTLAGVVIGFAGVGVLVVPGNGGDGRLLGVLLLVAAAASWAAGSFASTRLTLPADPFLSTAVQMLCGGAWLVAAGTLGGELTGLQADTFSAASIWAWVYLVLAGSLLAFTAYVWLLQNAPISKVATYAYVNPVIAIVLGALILSEEITGPMLIGAAIILASVAFIVSRESVPPRGDERAVEPSPVLAGASD